MMDGIEHANGHKPEGLTLFRHPSVTSALRPDPASLSYDLDAVAGAVLGLRSRAPEDAFSSTYLGTERIGNGVLIDTDGLVLTIGYLVSECTEIALFCGEGRMVHADCLAYDFNTGFGLLRAVAPVDAAPLVLGGLDDVAEGDAAVVAAYGGPSQAIAARVVSKREFAGYWEYLLDQAIFTIPPHPAWSGAALLGRDGRLAGIGSLYVQDALPGGRSAPGNMFVPADYFTRIADDLLTRGRVAAPPRPWVGLYATEALGRVLVTSVSDASPAERGGIEPGDIVLAVNDAPVRSLGDLYRKIWASGPAGVAVGFKLLREEKVVEASIHTIDRASRMKAPRAH